MRRPFAFLASLPERAVRLLAATGGGTLYQVSEVVLPKSLRRSTFYRATVARALRITVEAVGGVQGVMPPDGLPLRDLAKRKAAGNVAEFASILAVGWSPLWLLAAASDVTGGTKLYLRTLAAELRRNGLLTDGSGVTSFEDLLGRVETTSRALTNAIDLPPLNVEEIRATWESFQRNASELPGPENQAAIYSGLQQASHQSSRSLQEVSALVATSAVQAGIQLGNTHVFQYYQEALAAILQEGLPAYAQRIAAPYLTTAVKHLDARQPTYTERFLARLERWRKGGS